MIASLIAQVSTQRAAGLTVAAFVFIGAAGFVAWQMISARKETGSEVELAPNRKPYFDDEKLESTRLNYALWTSFGLLVVIAVALPFYWLAEPGRQEGAIQDFNDIFTRNGETIYVSGAQCVSCHADSGVGGVTSFIVTDDNGEFVQQVTWTAPALDTVMYRFDNEEVKTILTYGRPGTPMAAWGTAGGGPLTDQDLDKLIEYIWSIQIPPEEMRANYDAVIERFDPELAERMIAIREENGDTDPTTPEFKRLSEEDELKLGEFLFYLDDGSVGGNAGSCARCHVPGASYGAPWVPVGVSGTGAFAPNLVGIEDLLTENQHFNLVWTGTEFGVGYGANGQGDGMMPGFGLNASEGSEEVAARDFGPAGMLSAEQIWAIVNYERHLTEVREAAEAADAQAELEEFADSIGGGDPVIDEGTGQDVEAASANDEELDTPPGIEDSVASGEDA